MHSHPFPLRRLLASVLIGSGVLLFLAYGIFQARFLLLGPHLIFTAVPETAQTNRIVVLEGVAENITYLTLNDREIYTDEAGIFRQAILLENGYTIVTLTAADRYGRKRSYDFDFVYTPALTRDNQSSTYGS